MARFIVSSPASISGNVLREQLLNQLQTDGHVATAFAESDDVKESLRGADAVIAILDGEAPIVAGALLACASIEQKPTLVLHQSDAALHPLVESFASHTISGNSPADWFAQLSPFYGEVKPFAGRLVRDLIPNLVKEAGHDVTFRPLNDEEKPRFLKEKVLAEAQQLRSADLGTEKEEVADLLEVLETFIRARGYDRDSLKQIKDAKHKRRGGFEKGWVVEETNTSAASDNTGDSKPATAPVIESNSVPTGVASHETSPTNTPAEPQQMGDESEDEQAAFTL